MNELDLAEIEELALEEVRRKTSMKDGRIYHGDEVEDFILGTLERNEMGRA